MYLTHNTLHTEACIKATDIFYMYCFHISVTWP